MKRRTETERPDGAVIVKTYRDLESFVDAFAARHLNLLVLIGKPGLQKSRLVRERVGEDTCWIEAHATAFQIYIELYKHQDELVVIDDVDSLIADRGCVRLLKCLCQTEDEKNVSWLSDSSTLKEKRTPQRFTTKSKVAVICNSWSSINRNVAAVEDRAHLVVFDPSPMEVHERTAAWFRDEEIFEFVGRRIEAFGESHSMRLYWRALELKNAGMDWRRFLEARCGGDGEFDFLRKEWGVRPGNSMDD